MQVAAVEPEHDLSRHCLKHGALGIDAPRPAQSPMVQRGLRGRAECLDRVFMYSFGRGEILGLAISDICFGGSPIRPVRSGLDSNTGYRSRVRRDASRSVFLQEFLDDELHFAII